MQYIFPMEQSLLKQGENVVPAHASAFLRPVCVLTVYRTDVSRSIFKVDSLRNIEDIHFILLADNIFQDRRTSGVF